MESTVYWCETQEISVLNLVRLASLASLVLNESWLPSLFLSLSHSLAISLPLALPLPWGWNSRHILQQSEPSHKNRDTYPKKTPTTTQAATPSSGVRRCSKPRSRMELPWSSHVHENAHVCATPLSPSAAMGRVEWRTGRVELVSWTPWHSVRSELRRFCFSPLGWALFSARLQCAVPFSQGTTNKAVINSKDPQHLVTGAGMDLQSLYIYIYKGCIYYIYIYIGNRIVQLWREITLPTPITTGWIKRWNDWFHHVSFLGHTVPWSNQGVPWNISTSRVQLRMTSENKDIIHIIHDIIQIHSVVIFRVASDILWQPLWEDSK